MSKEFDPYLNLMSVSGVEDVSFSNVLSIENSAWDINEIIKNEKQKRKFRKQIINIIRVFTWIQLIFFNGVVGFIIFATTVDVGWLKITELATIQNMLDFLKFYVGATLVELIGLFGIIIRFVFSDNVLRDKSGWHKNMNKSFKG